MTPDFKDFLTSHGYTEEQIKNFIAHTNANEDLNHNRYVKNLREETKRIIIKDTFDQMRKSGNNDTEIILSLAKMFNSYCCDVFDYLWDYCNWCDLVIENEEEFIDSFY